MGPQAARLAAQIDLCNGADVTFSAAHKRNPHPPPPSSQKNNKNLRKPHTAAQGHVSQSPGNQGEGGEAERGREHAGCGVADSCTS